MAGLTVSAKQFVEKIKAALPKALLIADADATAEQAQDEVKAGANPNPYEGMLGTTGRPSPERWANKSPLLQQCVDIYEKATGTTVPGPDEETTNSNGKTVELDIAVTDFCGELFMFQTIAEKVGSGPHDQELAEDRQQLRQDRPRAHRHRVAVQGQVRGRRRVPARELRLDDGPDGDWKAVTPIKDASGGSVHEGREVAGRNYAGALLRWISARRCRDTTRQPVGCRVPVGGRAVCDHRARLEAVDARGNSPKPV